MRRWYALAATLLLITGSAVAQRTTFVTEPLGTGLGAENVYGLAGHGATVLAAADTAGVWMLRMTRELTGRWEKLPFCGCNRAARAIDFRGWTILVGMRGEADDTTAVLYRSDNAGTTWERSDSGITLPADEAFNVERVRFSPGDSNDVILLGLPTPYRSGDGGRSWLPIEGLAGLTINTIAWDPFVEGTLYAGGENMIFQPVLMKSTDNGTTWRSVLDITLGGDNAIDAIALHPERPGLLIAGTEGYFLRSENGGESWTITANPGSYYFRVAAWDGTPDLAWIAGGNSMEGAHSGIYFSPDRGVTWQLAAANEWTTLRDGFTLPIAQAFVFSAGEVSGENGTLPGGVFVVRAQTGGASSVPIVEERSRLELVDGGVHASAGREPAVWEMADPLGRLVASGTLPAGEDRLIRTDDLPSGVAFVALRDPDGAVETLKVVTGN